MRQAIDRYTAEKGEPPPSLDVLQQAGYLRAVPVDPITGTAETWTLDAAAGGRTAGIADVHSGAAGVARDGSPYSKW
jgi:general secretion pathway protein G